jgi:hypothetical protein
MSEQRFEIGRGGAQKMFLVLGFLALPGSILMLSGHEWGTGIGMLLGGGLMLAIALDVANRSPRSFFGALSVGAAAA